jgi:hypothetical protein
MPSYLQVPGTPEPAGPQVAPEFKMIADSEYQVDLLEQESINKQHDYGRMSSNDFIDRIEEQSGIFRTGPYADMPKEREEVKSGLKRIAKAYSEGHEELKPVLDRKRKDLGLQREYYEDRGMQEGKLPSSMLHELYVFGMGRKASEIAHNSNAPDQIKKNLKMESLFDVRGRKRINFEEMLDILDRGSTVGNPNQQRIPR